MYIISDVGEFVWVQDEYISFVQGVWFNSAKGCWMRSRMKVTRDRISVRIQ